MSLIVPNVLPPKTPVRISRNAQLLPFETIRCKRRILHLEVIIMRIVGILREYDFNETAMILGLSPQQLRRGVQEGWLQYFYRKGHEYKFHDASLEENRLRLQQMMR